MAPPDQGAAAAPPAVARLPDMAHLDAVSQQPIDPPSEPSQGPAPPPPPALPEPPSPGWSFEPFETREVRKARDRADRAARRADRAARRLQEARERMAGQRSGARQLVDAAGDAATAALTAVSTAADEAQARLAAKARMRELEHALVTARAGGPVEASPPTRDEALKLAKRDDPGSAGASFVRGIGFIVAGIVALAMVTTGGFGWLGFFVPLAIIIATGSVADRIRMADRSRKASLIQLEIARASLGPTERARATATAQEVQGGQSAPSVGATATAVPTTARPRLIENADPRTRAEVLAVLDRLVTNVSGLVPETDTASLLRIRHSAELALPTTDGPLDLTNHETWLVRQICIDYLPGALEHYIALPSDLASEPVLDGRSARDVLDEQLALIESRLDEMAAHTYRREADGLLTHARFVADSLRPDPFYARLAELATTESVPVPVAAPEAVRAAEAPVTSGEAATRVRERA
jgi:hypothetical protein